MTSVTLWAQQYSQGKLRLKRWVFRRLRKTGSDCADVTWCGRLFQTREATTGKARSLYIDSRVRHTTRDGDEAKRGQCRASTSGRGRRRGTTALHPWDTCKQEGPAYSQSAPVLITDRHQPLDNDTDRPW